ncbi:reverse transcriptase domain-containing protein [Tanacetum coccineum]
MEGLCQPTMNGRGGPIAPVTLQAMDFRLKNHMIQQVQNICQFHGLPGDDANKHLNKFLTITQSMKQNRVTNDALRLYLFPYSLIHHATAWFDRLLKNSIHTFEEMVSKFLSKYFPPMVTKLRNDISNFRQLPEESLFEAWEHTINAVAGGTFMERRPEECYDLIENMTAHHNDWDTSTQRGESSRSTTSSSPKIATLTQQMAEMNKNFLRMSQTNQQVNVVNLTLAQMPKYAKMLKDLLTNKEKLLELANTPLNENFSAVLLRKLLENTWAGLLGNFSFLVILVSLMNA